MVLEEENKNTAAEEQGSGDAGSDNQSFEEKIDAFKKAETPEETENENQGTAKAETPEDDGAKKEEEETEKADTGHEGPEGESKEGTDENSNVKQSDKSKEEEELSEESRLKIEFHEKMEKGHHKKAEEVLAKLPETTEGMDLMSGRLMGYREGLKAKPIIKKKKPDEPSDEAIIEAYLVLENLLAEKEVFEKQKKRPFTFYFAHFRQVVRLRRQFEKTRRV